ncbi:hypothetical protein SUGI_0630950 [Cryptomeria japonica]|nr:hypothetical protein SUGI_0630950 [Cryptomeria japonica]
MKIEPGKGESTDSNQIRNWYIKAEIPSGYGYQQQFVPGMMRGGAQLQNFIVRQGQRRGARRPPLQQWHHLQPQFQQQMIRRGSRKMRYPPVIVSYMGGVPVISQRLPIGTLSSALAHASPEQKRTMLGEILYPLVDQLEHDHAPKVTGMLLEMDHTEVLHLLESPQALKSKVAEAMEVLRNVSQQPTGPLRSFQRYP